MSMTIRREMAELGWDSEDRMTDTGWGGKVGYSIWFFRYDWHEHDFRECGGFKTCFHGHTENLDKIDQAVKETAERAKMAWDKYPTCLTFQDVYYRVRPNTIQPEWAVVPNENEERNTV